MKRIFGLACCLALGGCGLSGAQILAGATAVTCGLSKAAVGAQKVETKTYNGAPVVDDKGQMITDLVAAGSDSACTILGGVVLPAVPVPATPVVAP